MVQGPAAEAAESIFDLHEVPGPVFALKQQKDFSKLPPQPAEGQQPR
ncbi:hypothetical protein FDG2_2737 [Candidatus Protofrankia californiensis]|uniref:Uncharacterized protein n=1 Tax=Candidatus Protofrankia californiensis TaxID=1839754 RepID=A0A1C3NY35_9ACTN|nr:hypothetical protein FDG2_2737 [Candidatus Protofrankia californiensis]